MNPILIARTNCRSRKAILSLYALTAGAVLVVFGALSSCSTTRGLGRDVEKTGESIQRAASQ